MESAKLSKTKQNHNVFKLELIVTKGKLIAISNALNLHARNNGSTVAQDVLDMINRAAEHAGIDFDS